MLDTSPTSLLKMIVNNELVLAQVPFFLFPTPLRLLLCDTIQQIKVCDLQHFFSYTICHKPCVTKTIYGTQFVKIIKHSLVKFGWQKLKITIKGLKNYN
jgi:hypothetical protein